ncbi:GNAT family N-acetyltransferase [Rhodocaloribacter sp.]
MIHEVEFREGLEGLTPARIMTLYRRAPLIRPVDAQEKVWEMYENSSLVVTAWHEGHLVGIARVLTDGVLQSYLCDLAVEPDVQGLGIGKRMIDEVLERCKGTELLLRDSNISSTFYERLGFVRVENAWMKVAG